MALKDLHHFDLLLHFHSGESPWKAIHSGHEWFFLCRGEKKLRKYLGEKKNIIRFAQNFFFVYMQTIREKKLSTLSFK